MVLPASIFDIVEEADDYYFPPVTGTYPDTTLSGVLSIFGVLIEARRRPSIVNSRIRNCQINGIFMVSLIAINSKPFGTYSGYSVKSRNTGVKITAKKSITMRDRRRYVPVTGGK